MTLFSGPFPFNAERREPHKRPLVNSSDISLLELTERFPEKPLVAWFEQRRWKKTRTCGHCESELTAPASHKKMVLVYHDNVRRHDFRKQPDPASQMGDCPLPLCHEKVSSMKLHRLNAQKTGCCIATCEQGANDSWVRSKWMKPGWDRSEPMPTEAKPQSSACGHAPRKRYCDGRREVASSPSTWPPPCTAIKTPATRACPERLHAGIRESLRQRIRR